MISISYFRVLFSFKEHITSFNSIENDNLCLIEFRVFSIQTDIREIVHKWVKFKK